MTQPTVGYLMPVPDRASGGNTYNDAVLAHWPGRAPARVELPGRWPTPPPAEVDALGAALLRCDVSIVDGLVGAAHPDLIAAAQAAGRRVVLVVHMPLALDAGLTDTEATRLDALEQRSVEAAWKVVAPSAHAASEIVRRHGRRDVDVVRPGADPAPVAEPHDPPHVVCVGTIGPAKNQLAFARALAQLTDLPWRASLIGRSADSSYARLVANALPQRARLAGPLAPAHLADVWLTADLLVHPSRHETWGLVVTDALARGVPAIVSQGTGAAEALASGTFDGELPGDTIDPENPDALARLLRRWLTDRDLRSSWRAAALRSRSCLRRWDAPASEFATLVGGGHHPLG